VEQSEEEGQVAAWHGLEVHARAVVGEGGGGAGPGVHDDETAVVARAVQVCHRRRHRLGEVAAQEEDGVGPAEVGQGKGEATVETKGPVGRRRSAAHAEASVVVDVGRAQGHPRELPQLVGLLVGQAASAEDGDGVSTARLPDLPQAQGDEVEGGLP
jgi:hypothetical protein